MKTEDQGREILFSWVLCQQKSEADLMLALNKVLQKAGEEIGFIKSGTQHPEQCLYFSPKKPMPDQLFLGY